MTAKSPSRRAAQPSPDHCVGVYKAPVERRLSWRLAVLYRLRTLVTAGSNSRS
jgi:hypothetical protein